MAEIDLSRLVLRIPTPNGGEDSFSLGKIVHIDEDNLSEGFSTQAALLAWWASMTEEALHELRKQQSALEMLEAELSMEYRKALDAKGDKVTEGKLASLVKCDEGYIDRVAALHAAKHRAEMLKVGLRATEERGRMLISLGAHKRAEMDAFGNELMLKVRKEE